MRARRVLFGSLAGVVLALLPLGCRPASPPAAVPAAPAGERLTREEFWHPTFTIRKWRKSADFAAGKKPNAVQVVKGNLLLNGGITELLKLLCGTGGTAYSNANANMVVGDSATAAAASQTDMQGTTAVVAMDATYPTVSSQTATWRATYGSGVANFHWQEIGVKNGSGAVSGSVLMLDRKVSDMGTKVSGSTWTVTLTLTIS